MNEGNRKGRKSKTFLLLNKYEVKPHAQLLTFRPMMDDLQYQISINIKLR